MDLEFEKLYKLGTDVAAFLFFDPDLLSHRAEEKNIAWWSDDFRQEFSQGTLAAFCTGSDGQFTMKFVQRPLSQVEREVLVSSGSFRFVVRNGRFYWDNSNGLPCEDQLDDPHDDENGWVAIENGQYKLTVHALDWYSVSDSKRELAGDISHYIVELERAGEWGDIAIPEQLPWLMPSKQWHEQRLQQLNSLYEDMS
tara:strand:+ start:543 stop:1133 length:591 start_codon:yes stop_codon:yes gene_type:complete